MSVSKHRQRSDLAANCMRRLEVELLQRGTPVAPRRDRLDSIAGKMNRADLGEEPSVPAWRPKGPATRPKGPAAAGAIAARLRRVVMDD